MDAAEALQELSRPWPEGDNTKSAIGRVARLLHMPYWRVFDIWYRKAQRFNADEAEIIRSAIQKRREEEARNEFEELRTRLLKMEARLAATDSDFYRPHIDFVRQQLRRPGPKGRAVDRGEVK